MSGQSISQTFRTPDSSKIANKDLRKAAILIEQGKAAWEQVRLLEKQIGLLEKRIDGKDSVVVIKNEEIDLHKRIIQNHLIIEDKYQQQILIGNETIKQLEKSLRRQKFKTRFITIVSVLGVGYLLLK